MNREICGACGSQYKQGRCACPCENREWIGLTRDEVDEIIDINTHDDCGYDVWTNPKGVAEMVETKLKEKNYA